MEKQKTRFLVAAAAVFAAATLLLTLSGCGGDPLAGLVTYQLTVRSDGHGTTDPSGTLAVNKGDATSIKATPGTGYAFSSWTVTSGSGATFASPSAASTTVTLSAGNATVQANFTAHSYVLTVVSGGNGTVSPTGNVAVDHGAATTISAAPAAGYGFLNWTVTSGTGVTFGNANTASTTVSLTGGNATVQANFAQDIVALTVTNDGNGATNPTGNANAASGVATSITATPNTGYHFAGWTVINGTGVTFGNAASASTTVTLTGGSATIRANFAINTYVLTTSVNNAAYGSVTVPISSPMTVNHGAATPVTATPTTGYHFTGWSVTSGSNVTFGDPGQASTTVTLEIGSATIRATFAPDEYTLTVNAAAHGTITTPAAGSVTATHGAATAIAASPATGYQFVNWTSSGSGVSFGSASSASTTVTLTAGDASVTANFTIITYQLTVTTDGHGTIAAPASSPVSVTHGAATTITATPTTGYHFTNWSNPTGSANIANTTVAGTTVTLTSGDATVQANFAINTYTLTVNKSGIGTSSSTVTLNPASGPYNHGSTVIMTPVADSGYYFDHWSGDVSGSDNPYHLTITANTTVTAVFVSPEINLLAYPPGGGMPESKASGTTVTVQALMGTPVNPFPLQPVSTDLNIQNTGMAALTIISWGFTNGTEMYWQATPPLPGGVDPMSSFAFTVVFAGAPPGTYTTMLTIIHSDVTDSENPYTLTFTVTVQF